MTSQPTLDIPFPEKPSSRKTELREIEGRQFTFIYDEFWTARQRQAKAIHEVSYRACFKPQLPEFFISRYSHTGDIVYDPFAGRGTTAIQAALMGRSVIQNDVNPLSKILTEPRLLVPEIDDLRNRLNEIEFDYSLSSDIDLSMFFHERTLSEIITFRNYLDKKRMENSLDAVDKWIAMVWGNRLTGHSSGFFSVYSFPPNIAVSQQSQVKINQKRNQVPEYRDTKEIILKKSLSLQSDLTTKDKNNMRKAWKSAKFLTELANETKAIASSSVQLVVTSPPFLDVVQYSDDNWMRCWFNNIQSENIEKRITMSKTTLDWRTEMQKVIIELYRVVKPGGYLAFEVGEIRNKSIRLDELIIPLGEEAGFAIDHIMVNTQDFTKTANLWGVSNNSKGTNTNRIVLMSKI